MLADLEISNANARSSTGVLASHPQSRDIKVEQVTLNFYGGELLADTKLELTFGHRWALKRISIGLQIPTERPNILRRVEQFMFCLCLTL